MTGLCGQDAECTDSSRLQQILPGVGSLLQTSSLAKAQIKSRLLCVP